MQQTHKMLYLLWGLGACASTALAQTAAPRYIISTIAGQAPPPTPVQGVDLSIQYPLGVATDSSGNVYFSSDNCVFKLDQNGVATRIAGNSRAGYSGDGGPAASAQLNSPLGLAMDAAGDLFILDSGNYRVRKVSPSGIITTVGGNGAPGHSGDGGPATSAQLDTSLSYPAGVAVDVAGNLFIADSNRVRKVSLSGIITTVAGGGNDVGDGGPATSAKLNPGGVAVNGLGDLFIANSGNYRVFKVSPSGIITTVAGNGTPGHSGDGGPATSAQLYGPTGVAVDGSGNLFVAESYSDDANGFTFAFIRKVSSSGIITTVAGNGTAGFAGDGGLATSASLGGPSAVAVDDAGNLFIANDSYDGDGRVQKVASSGIITTVAGSGHYGSAGDGGPATGAQLNRPENIAVDGAGNLFIGDRNGIHKVSAGGIITTLMGDGLAAISAQLGALGTAVDAAGNRFISDLNHYLVRKVSQDGVTSIVAGNGTAGYSGDGGPATSAQLSVPYGLAVDGAGNLFIADVYSSHIRVVSRDGIITTVAGNTISPLGGYSGDGGFATSAQLAYPYGVAVDSEGNVYVADTFNNAVRVMRPTKYSVLISAVLDAASEQAGPISPGKMVVIYGAGLGPAQLVQNQPSDSQFGTAVGGTVVSFNGIAAPILYASAAAVAAIVPYAISGTTAQVTVTYQGQVSAAFTVPVAPSAPSLFTANETGAGQMSAVNTIDGTANTAASPVKIGGFISLYATGEGQTSPSGVDGTLGGATSTQPLLPVSVTVGGIKATVQSKGGVQGQVAGLMEITVQIPNGVQPGGYVPVVLQVGDASTTPDAVWIAIAGK